MYNVHVMVRCRDKELCVSAAVRAAPHRTARRELRLLIYLFPLWELIASVDMYLYCNNIKTILMYE